MLNNDIKVKAVDIATEENYTLRISKKEAYEIMGGFRSWDSMTRYLDLENGELVLYQAKDSDVSFHQYTHNTVGHIELEDSFL